MPQTLAAPDQVRLLAAAVAASGLGAAFCRWQRTDTETWLAAADLLDSRGMQ